MPSHNGHELFLYPVALLVLWLMIGYGLVFLVACGVVAGTLWLSPDLDLESAPWRRWWVLKGIWRPYQMALSHRSPLSHWPIIGTTVRLAYLAAVPCVVLTVLTMLGEFNPVVLRVWFSYHDAEVYAVLAGIEASALLHYSLDWVT